MTLLLFIYAALSLTSGAIAIDILNKNTKIKDERKEQYTYLWVHVGFTIFILTMILLSWFLKLYFH